MNCSDVRGFNYNGSWGTSGLDLWQHFDHGTMAVEITRGKRYFPGWNVVRWWLSHQAFQRNPDRFAANFEAGLSIFARNDILVMPVLFNRWRDPTCDYGDVSLEHIVPGLSNMSGLVEPFGSPVNVSRHPPIVERVHRRFIDAVVGAHVEDGRIFAWDLCNEPLMGPYAQDPNNPLRVGELGWLTWLYQTVKQAGARQPLTVGSYPNLLVQELVEPISDFFSIHPYYVWNAAAGPTQDVPGATKAGFEAYLDASAALAQRAGKEVLATETVWGAVDDAQRVEVLRYTLEQLHRRAIGFIVYALQHSLVADLHYPSYGPIGWPETLHFVNPDGSLRAGHEAFNEF